tara:strand:- start:958 stop:1119 length:162 start_codon:yes stop_codon:yes gene_type:complete
MSKKYNKCGQEIRVMLEDDKEYLSGWEVVGGFLVLLFCFVPFYIILLIGAVYE